MNMYMNPLDAYDHALRTLGGRWPEAELHIMEDSKNAKEYSDFFSMFMIERALAQEGTQ